MASSRLIFSLMGISFLIWIGKSFQIEGPVKLMHCFPFSVEYKAGKYIEALLKFRIDSLDCGVKIEIRDSGASFRATLCMVLATS